MFGVGIAFFRKLFELLNSHPKNVASGEYLSTGRKCEVISLGSRDGITLRSVRSFIL